MTEAAFRRILLRLVLPPVVAVALLATILIGLINLLNFRAQRFDHADVVIAQAAQLLNSMMDEETGSRGYVATNEPLFLAPYHAAVERVDGQMGLLKGLLNTSSDGSVQVKGIQDSFRNFERITNQMVKSLPQGEDRVRLMAEQKTAMDDLRLRIGDLITSMNEIRRQRSLLLASSVKSVREVEVAGCILLLAVIAWSSSTGFRRASEVYTKQLSAVRLQYEWLDTTLKSIGDAVIACDAEGNVSFMNSVAEMMTGWKTEEAKGHPLAEIFVILNEYTHQSVESPVDKVRRMGVIVGLANHTVLVRRDGTKVSIDDSGAPIRNTEGKMEGVVLVFRDIEERRRAERDLARKTAELEALLLHAPAGIALFDPDHRFMRANRELAIVNGFAEESHVGRSVEEVDPDNGPLFKEILSRVFREGVSVQEEIVTNGHWETSTERQWLACFFPVFQQEDQPPISVGAILLETTEKRQTEEALRRAEKLAVVGRLTASIAHEMNNPLESVTNLLYIALNHGSLSGDTRPLIEQAQQELARVSSIATQTLRFAKRSTAPVSIDLRDIMDGVLLIFSGRLSATRIVVVRRFAAAPHIRGHQNELTQLFVNLIGNAVDALKGTGNLIVCVKPAIDGKSGRKGVAIVIADNAQGIPAAIRKKIWEPFFTTKSDTGTGLGLWLVEEMVRNNRGTIRMRSSTGEKRHGTVFRVFLPGPDSSRGEPASSEILS